HGGLRIPDHEHANAFLSLVLEGTYTETLSDGQRIRGPATLAVHPPGERHADVWHGSGGLVFHLEGSPRRPDLLRPYTNLFDSLAEFEGGVPVWLAPRLYREQLRDDSVAPLAMEGIALELFAACSRGETRTAAAKGAPPWLCRAREFVQEHFAESI